MVRGKNKISLERIVLETNLVRAQQDDEGDTVQVEGHTVRLSSEFLRSVLVALNTQGCYLLGGGSYGEVYCVTCPGTEQKFALKHLRELKYPRNNMMTEARRIKLLREIDVHKKLDHENIIKLYGCVRNDTYGIVLAMRLAEQGSLYDLMEDKKLKRSNLVLIVEQVLKGLEYLHGYTDQNGKFLPIVHRDLTCKNILMDAKGVIKIADFGLSKTLEEVHDMLSSTKGCIYFMAPEVLDQRSGRNRGLDPSVLVLSDVWSLGIVILSLYYYGAKRIPFLQQKTTQHCHETYICTNKKRPAFPPDAPKKVISLLEGCLVCNVLDRESATSLLRKIDRFDTKMLSELSDDINNLPDNHTDAYASDGPSRRKTMDKIYLLKDTFDTDSTYKIRGFSDDDRRTLYQVMIGEGKSKLRLVESKSGQELFCVELDRHCTLSEPSKGVIATITRSKSKPAFFSKSGTRLKLKHLTEEGKSALRSLTPKLVPKNSRNSGGERTPLVLVQSLGEKTYDILYSESDSSNEVSSTKIANIRLFPKHKTCSMLVLKNSDAPFTFIIAAYFYTTKIYPKTSNVKR